MPTWREFAAANPTLAAKGRELLYRTGSGEALLGERDSRDDWLPRYSTWRSAD